MTYFILATLTMILGFAFGIGLLALITYVVTFVICKVIKRFFC